MNAYQKGCKSLLILALAMVWLCSVAATPAVPPFVTALMHESFQQFDQQLGSGWRTLELKPDYPDAATAILRYKTEHAAELKGWQQDSLSFHLAHVYALAGERSKAINWFKRSMGDPSWGNAAYIEAFIAFLQNDKPALIKARKIIATTNPGPWQKQDLSEIDAMVEYFGEPFEAAWGALNCHNSSMHVTTPVWRAYCHAIDAKYRKLYLQHGIKPGAT